MSYSLAELTITGLAVWELTKIIILPAVVALASWLYKLTQTVRDHGRDISQLRTDTERELVRLAADRAADKKSVADIAFGQQQVQLAIARLEIQLAELTKAVVQQHQDLNK